MADIQECLKSVEDCISVLQGDLHQPGTPAIVLKLAATWQKVKAYLVVDRGKLQLEDNCKQAPNSLEETGPPAPGNEAELVKGWSQGQPTSQPTSQLPPQPSTPSLAQSDSAVTCKPVSDSGSGSEEPSKQLQTQSSALGGGALVPPKDGGGVSGGAGGLQESHRDLSGDSSAVSSGGNTSNSSVEPVAMGEEYQRVEYPVLYYHKTSGYYYDPSTQQFFAPSSYYQVEQQNEGAPGGVDVDSAGGQADSNVSAGAGQVNQAAQVSQAAQEGTQASTAISQQPAQDYNVSQPAQDYSASQSAQNYNVSQPVQDYSASQSAQNYNVSQPAQDYSTSVSQDYNVSQPTQDYNVSQPTQDYNVSQPAQDYNVSQPAASTGQAKTSIADMLAAVSDRALDRCGYQYDEYLDMFYDANSNLYYHQESKLYYDADLGCYYEYDFEKKKYSLHSRVALPDFDAGRKRGCREARSSSPEFIDADDLEEGEIRLPHIPHGSPPPEEDWAPCLRAVVTESDKLPKGTLFVVTQDGASIGREPTGSKGSLITIPELKVSKLHAKISYDKHEKSFMVQDLGSVNGTFLNKDQRLCESKEKSQPCPLVHGHTLSLGSTTLSLHIHAGWETCAWCDPSRARGMFQDLGSSEGAMEAEPQEELGVQRRKELNRIKKKYGLRYKDTYGEGVALQEGYSDRSETRRRTVGSDMPYESQRPDDAPASVDEPITAHNKGRKLLEGMGWQEGQGLGKSGEGIRDPVRGEIRDTRAGLGTKNSARSLDSSYSTSTTSKRSSQSEHVRSRFEEVVQRHTAKKKRLDIKNL